MSPERWSGRRACRPIRSKDFAVVRAQNLTSVDEGRGWLNRNDHDGHVLVFVHGFNNRYEDSVFRFAQIVHDSGANVAPILFTWPSRASVFDYNYDKESTNFSRTALERTLATLVADPTVKDITVMAHSMGTWLAMEALRQMAITGRQPAGQDRQCRAGVARPRRRCLCPAMVGAGQAEAEDHHLRLAG